MILAFADVETTHLSAEVGEIWEIAAIRRNPDGTETERVWQFRPIRPSAVDPEALRIGRFEERFVVPTGAMAADTTNLRRIVPMRRKAAVRAVTEALSGATIVGSNPAFDDRFLRKLLNLRGAKEPWAYRPTCIANLAEGHLWALNHDLMAKRQAEDPNPPSSHWLSRQVGVEPPGDDVAHTALGDARWAKAVHDAITGSPRRTGAVSD